MFFQTNNKITIVDKKGTDRQIVESILVKDVNLFAEAELKSLEWYNNENEVVAIKMLPKLMEFVNDRVGDTDVIYCATIESLFTDDDDNEKTTRYNVGVYAETLEEATATTIEYMKGGMTDLSLISIKKTRIVEVI